MQKKERGDDHGHGQLFSSAAATAVASARKALELAVKSLKDQKDRAHRNCILKQHRHHGRLFVERSGNCGDQQEETYP